MYNAVHTYFVVLVSGKSNIKLRQYTCPFELLQFLLVQEVFVPMPTAKVKYCLTNILPCNRAQNVNLFRSLLHHYYKSYSNSYLVPSAMLSPG